MTTLDEISIRTDLEPGDIGYITYMHGSLYKKEYDFDVDFEAYVARGLAEFYREYKPAKNGSGSANIMIELLASCYSRIEVMRPS